MYGITVYIVYLTVQSIIVYGITEHNIVYLTVHTIYVYSITVYNTVYVTARNIILYAMIHMFKVNHASKHEIYIYMRIVHT